MIHTHFDLEENRMKTSFFFVVILIILLLSSCTDNQTGPPNLIDPSVKPQVLWTDPPAGAIGPFAGLHTINGSTGTGYYFMAQFNKVMSAPQQYPLPVCSSCAGFIEPVSVEPFLVAGGSVVGFYLYDYDPNEQYAIQTIYEVGKTYTVVIDTSLMDINGNHLARPYYLRYTPEPYFRITSTSPADGATIVPTKTTNIQIYFNSKVDTSILSHIHPSSGFITHSSAGGYDAIYTLGNYLPGQTITLTIDQGAKDVSGNALRSASQMTVHTGAFALTSVDTAEYALDLDQGLDFYFSYPLDTSTVFSSILVSPPTELAHYRLYPNNYVYASPLNDWIPNSSYTITIKTSLLATNGVGLDRQYAVHFITEPFEADYAEYENYSSSIEILCTGRIDSTSMQAAFSISPNVPGRTTFSPSSDFYPSYDRFWFVPDTALTSGMTYRITVSTALKSIGGYHPTSTYSTQIFP